VPVTPRLTPICRRLRSPSGSALPARLTKGYLFTKIQQWRNSYHPLFRMTPIRSSYALLSVKQLLKCALDSRLFRGVHVSKMHRDQISHAAEPKPVATFSPKRANGDIQVRGYHLVHQGWYLGRECDYVFEVFAVVAVPSTEQSLELPTASAPARQR
jgi:hypothetical protein